MFTQKILNPKTKRQNNMRCWRVEWSTIIELLKSGKSAKDISWMFLNDDQSVQVMDDEQYGDSQSNNFALNVFENALDYAIGIKILQYVRFLNSMKKKHDVFVVACNRGGDVFIVSNKTGRVIFEQLNKKERA